MGDSNRYTIRAFDENDSVISSVDFDKKYIKGKRYDVLKKALQILEINIMSKVDGETTT